MRDALGPGTLLGYCTNVHAGDTLEQTLSNLQQHAARVRQLLERQDPMGVGLWLSADAARAALDDDGVAVLRDRLGQLGLLAYTINGFPYGNFHQPVVKHAVYEPDWTDPRREAYTIDLAHILSGLLDEGDEGSISTLPLGWSDQWTESNTQAATARLRTVAQALHRIEAETGRFIHVDLEPEPGCVMQDADTTIEVFQNGILSTGDEMLLRRHLQICHDVCHTAVMFEDQRDVLQRYQAHGLSVGKVQISNAVRVDLDQQRKTRLAQVAAFAEDRYLHQTVARTTDGTLRFHEDLPQALQQVGHDDDQWRVHFHVPIDLERFHAIETTRDHVEAMIALRDTTDCRHFEVETYAWDVLPPELRRTDLATGIADELRFVMQSARG
jgi:hypothetical protein